MSSTLNYSPDLFFNPKIEKGAHFVPLNYKKNCSIFNPGMALWVIFGMIFSMIPS
jgi:hypothetical protein